MTTTTTNIQAPDARRARRSATLAGLASMALATAGFTAQPTAVSPGAPGTAQATATACPTFSWATLAEAQGYELILYRVDAAGALEEALRTRVPAGAASWTPPADQCPSAGSEYAWALRGFTDDGATPWSQPLLFSTPGTPSEDEVQMALETLRRYRKTSVARARNVGGSVADVGLEAARPITEEPASSEVGTPERPEGGAPTFKSGSPAVESVVAPASFSMSLDGSLDLGGYIFKGNSPFLHNDGASNTALGLRALISTTSGWGNTASGYEALRYMQTGYQNTAVGRRALWKSTSNANTAIGHYALRDTTVGNGNTAIGRNTMMDNVDGALNTAVGFEALLANVDGDRNTAVGNQALRTNVSGVQNTAVGGFALRTNATGSYNTALGYQALRLNDGDYNTAMGRKALEINTSGDNNTAVGREALRDATGSFNTAIGFGAGFNATGDNNIRIGRGSYGTGASEIRIGGAGFQTKTFIEGIDAATGSTFTTNVCIDAATNQLGPCSLSSARFKEEIEPLEEDLLERLAELDPVSFRYTEEYAGSGERARHYGFVAEQVAEVFPSLISLDADGRPQTVRYDLLTPLLLAELRRQEDHFAAALAERDQELAGLRRRIERLSKKRRFR